ARPRRHRVRQWGRELQTHINSTGLGLEYLAAVRGAARCFGLMVGAKTLSYAVNMAALWYAADLLAAQGIWLVSSMTLAARVHTLDGHVLLPSAPMAAEFAELVDAAIVSVR